jgi:hypothetical protein
VFAGEGGEQLSVAGPRLPVMVDGLLFERFRAARDITGKVIISGFETLALPTKARSSGLRGNDRAHGRLMSFYVFFAFPYKSIFCVACATMRLGNQL